MVTVELQRLAQNPRSKTGINKPGFTDNNKNRKNIMEKISGSMATWSICILVLIEVLDDAD